MNEVDIAAVAFECKSKANAAKRKTKISRCAYIYIFREKCIPTHTYTHSHSVQHIRKETKPNEIC